MTRRSIFKRAVLALVALCLASCERATSGVVIAKEFSAAHSEIVMEPTYIPDLDGGTTILWLAVNKDFPDEYTLVIRNNLGRTRRHSVSARQYRATREGETVEFK